MIKHFLICNLYRFRILFTVGFTLLVGMLYAQQSPLNQLQEQFTRYHGNALQEKLFIHTTKDVFFGGETIFFKIYDVDGMLHQPLNLNSVVYVEMIDNRNQPIVQLKVALKNDGTGNGSLIVPDSVTSGRYRIVGYTSWMRNFSADFFFAKDITVISPLKTSVKNKEDNPSNLVVKFFPEGGDLVYGLESKIGFQATTAFGKGVDVTGAILTETNDTLLRFQSLKFGLGNFVFKPVKGKRYKAYVKSKNGSVVSELPSPLDEGYVMTVSEDSSAELKINIQSTKSPGGEVYLFMHNRQRVRKLLSATLDSSGNALFAIPAAEIEEGISHITLFDRQLNPVAERLHFKQPEDVIDIHVDQLKKSYGKREQVQVMVKTSDRVNKPLPANLSLSIFRIDNVQQYDSLDIVNFLLLTSDLKGFVESPGYYLTPGVGKRKAVDNLMLTHGWRRFTWQDVIKSNWPVVQFSPEIEGMNIRATVSDEQNNPKANASLFLSTQSKEIRFFPGRTNARGFIQFYSRDLYGKREIIFQQVADSSKFNISLISPYTTTYPVNSFSSFSMRTDEWDLIRSYSIHRQVQNGFYTSTEVAIKNDTVPFYGAPDKSYLLADYVSFPLMLDVFKEYVFEIVVRKSENKYHLFLLNKDTQQFFENEPFVLLDGVPVFDSHRIATLPAQNIKKMDVVNRKFLYGPFVFNGIISLTSYDSSKYRGVQLNPEAVVFEYEGLQRSQEFYSPAYHEVQVKESRLPDFRNVLLWEPDIKTDLYGKSTISFSTSDLPGNYIGVINGLSNNGQPGSLTFTFEVD